MRAECIDAVNKAAQAIGKKLTVEDLKNIEGKIREARRQLAKQDMDAYRSMTNEEQIEKAGELVVKQALHDAIKKRQRADLTVIKKSEREAVMGRMIADGIDHLEALRRFTFSVADGKGKVVPFEAYSNGLSRYYLGKLTDFNEYVKESSFLGVMTNKKMRDDFEMESFGISSGNPKAKKAWDNLYAVRKEMIEHNNRLGGDIVPLANYRNPQNTSQFLILRRGGKDGKNYIDDHMQWVDRSEYVKPDGTMMDDAELRTFLHEAFITQATDGANKPAGAGMGGSIANRGKAHRQIHYKSPEAYRAAMEKYGSGNSFDQAIQSIESMANDIALMDKFGPNAVHEFNDAYSNAARNSGGRTDELMNSAFKRMSGQISTAHPMVAHYVGELKSAMVASRLGSMLFSQISDLSTMTAAARAMNIPKTELASWVANVASDGNLRDTLRIHGLGVESALNTIVRFAEGATNTGMFGKFATAIPTIQGAHLWTKSLRQAFGAMMEAKVGDMAAKYDSMAKLPETDRKIFEAIGINDTDWAIYRLAKPFEYKGNKLMNSEAIENIPVSELVKAIPEKVAQIRKDASDFIGRMEEQNQKEAGWVQGRQTKFSEFKDKIQKTIDSYIATREKNKGELGDEIQARIDLLTARRNEADVRLASITGDVAEGVRLGGEVQKAIDATREAKMRLSRFESKADRQVFAKAAELEKRVDAQMKELDDFIYKFEEKAKERNQWAKEYESKIGSRIEREAEIVRQDAAIKFVSLVAEQSEQAILQPGALSQSTLSSDSRRGTVYGELGSLMTQFKSFPMAFFRQTLMERANFQATGYSHLVFRAKMMASTTMLGAVAVLLNELASGKDMRDFEKDGALTKLAREGFLKGGGLGFGNEVIEALTGSVENPWSSGTKVLGPGIGYLVGSVAPAIGYGVQYAASGLEDEKAQKNFTKNLYKSTIGAAPGQNLWFLKGFLHNVMLDDFQEMANPGYKQRAKERIAKQGQEYWLGMD